ncbi:hypothetical protein LTR37_001114 [Vermiconidia calcicola]|uniref:Uncharacterized protein n=1 Tax=Vermiconidia calcicola TaxID=1690605 RepID=A0ACC3NYE9_9PEZI|nr:hypothetical protein LTR37_001114 [Vermiconidia calcicola]
MSEHYSNTDTGSKPADPYTDKNLQEPGLQEKIEGLNSFADRCKFCMMTTKMNDGNLASRCMALAGKENTVDFIFHTNTESGKTDDLKANPDINLGFLNNTGEWASVSGEAIIETDRDAVKKHYSPALKAWLGDLGDGIHNGEADDPRIALIRVKTKTAQYAVSYVNSVTSTFQVVKGAVTGETPAVNKLRHLSEDECNQARSGSS